MLGVFAEFETNLRKERQMESIAKAKAAGVYKGRPPSLTALRCNSSRLKAGDHLRSPASSASPAHPSIGLWRVTDAYVGGFRFSIFVTSGDFNGSSPLQSRHRNLRPPAFTSVHCMGLLHLRQRGGGRFLTTMMLTLNWAGAQNSQSPIEAEDGR